MQRGKWWSLTILAVAQVLALSLWFSATAIVPVLRQAAIIDTLQASFFTSAVQAGFVIGTLLSASLGLADRIDPRRLFTASCLVAALANAALLAVPMGSILALALRLVTGICMAGIYPIGMKLAATWAAPDKQGRSDLGFLVGLLVGALTLGSASPHLINAIEAAGSSGIAAFDWRWPLALTSVAAGLAALLIQMAGLGPNLPPMRVFHIRMVFEAWRSPGLRLANLGYLGHMWELYAMWAWMTVFLEASFRNAMPGPEAAYWARLGTFVTLGAGAAGCLIGGWCADRWGRTSVTIAALLVSGTCCCLAGLFFAVAPGWLLLLCVIWGISVVADSPQFSASITELAEREHVGTMLTIQTCAGFLLSMITIHLLPWLAGAAGWRWVFLALAPGPAVGIWAMYRLRRSPMARQLAGGRR
ncbi:MFS transporter [Dongia soli]|uniref:MFS transporter n=1 Tax=Dongia soli TaxID=600628 RepID=A0ABU5E6Q4_9PROT|nr:MFS transporter [Dongia soli]MDY0881819.1 MFS transporter [Dongia soli]